MESAEPLVERDKPVAVVHLEILMMEVVDVGMRVERTFFADLTLVKNDMTGDRAKAGAVLLIKCKLADLTG